MRRVILTLLGLIALSLLIFYTAVIEAPRIERDIQAEAVQRLNNAGIAGVSVRADGRQLLASGQAGVADNALRVLRQQLGVQQADWQTGSLGFKATTSTGIHSASMDVSGNGSAAAESSPATEGEAASTDAESDVDASGDAEATQSTEIAETDPVATGDAASESDTDRAVVGTAGVWATGLRLDDDGLSVSGDSIDDGILMQSTISKLRDIAGDSRVNIAAKTHEDLPISWAEAVLTGATVLKQMGGGNAVLSNGQLKITGLVQDREQEQEIRRALVQLTPPDLTWRTEFTYVDDGSDVEGVSAFVCNSNLSTYMRGKKVIFERASTSLSFESFEVLDGVAAILSECPAVRVEVAGFTDARGSLELNNRISQERADTVRLYLVEHGVAASRILATGYGPQRPIATNETPEGRALNRRIEFNVFGE